VGGACITFLKFSLTAWQMIWCEFEKMRLTSRERLGDSPIEIYGRDIRERFSQKGLSMKKAKNDQLQGTLAMLALKSLEHGPMHGWGITLHIEGISNQVLRVEEGSLYPALHRMEQQGWISSEWGLSENNRRARYYRLTASGRKQMATEEKNWRETTSAVGLVMSYLPAKG
jgi:PadR family transcriptional regulator PadR